MKKKKWMMLVLIGSGILGMYGCGKQELEMDQSMPEHIETEGKTEGLFLELEQQVTKEENGEKKETETVGETKGTEAIRETTEKEVEVRTEEETEAGRDTQDKGEGFSFADLKNVEFYFSSGAGGWRTVLTIDEDGNFSGEYLDNDMEVGENYQGIAYQCKFSGQFTQPVKVNEYTYSVQADRITYEREAGTEEIKDGMLYRYVDAYGLENVETVLIYLPGAPYAELPEEFRMWVRNFDGAGEADVKLPFYALNNLADQSGFSGYSVIHHAYAAADETDRREVLIEELEKSVADSEMSAEQLEESIRNDILTQLEYNEKTQELYNLWDALLNQIWDVLKQTQDEETMKGLTAEQLEWIALKEEEMAKAGAEYEGGSMQAMVVNQTAAEMTRVRVYELMEKLR